MGWNIGIRAIATYGKDSVMPPKEFRDLSEQVFIHLVTTYSCHHLFTTIHVVTTIQKELITI